MKIENIQSLFEFNSFTIEKIAFSQKNTNLFIHRDRRKSKKCPVCGNVMGKNRTVTRKVYDLPMGTTLNVVVPIETFRENTPIAVRRKVSCRKEIRIDQCDYGTVQRNRRTNHLKRLRIQKPRPSLPQIMPTRNQKHQLPTRNHVVEPYFPNIKGGMITINSSVLRK